jgi:hypothetical protein
MIYLEQYHNNTIITPERAPLLMIEMFTCLFEGETSSTTELYYNNLQEKPNLCLLHLFILIPPSKETSRGRSF